MSSKPLVGVNKNLSGQECNFLCKSVKASRVCLLRGGDSSVAGLPSTTTTWTLSVIKGEMHIVLGWLTGISWYQGRKNFVSHIECLWLVQELLSCSSCRRAVLADAAERAALLLWALWLRTPAAALGA